MSYEVFVAHSRHAAGDIAERISLAMAAPNSAATLAGSCSLVIWGSATRVCTDCSGRLLVTREGLLLAARSAAFSDRELCPEKWAGVIFAELQLCRAVQ